MRSKNGTNSNSKQIYFIIRNHQYYLTFNLLFLFQYSISHQMNKIFIKYRSLWTLIYTKNVKYLITLRICNIGDSRLMSSVYAYVLKFVFFVMLYFCLYLRHINCMFLAVSLLELNFVCLEFAVCWPFITPF
jgi:hypothetical protein